MAFTERDADRIPCFGDGFIQHHLDRLTLTVATYYPFYGGVFKVSVPYWYPSPHSYYYELVGSRHICDYKVHSAMDVSNGRLDSGSANNYYGQAYLSIINDALSEDTIKGSSGRDSRCEGLYAMFTSHKSYSTKFFQGFVGSRRNCDCSYNRSDVSVGNGVFGGLFVRYGPASYGLFAYEQCNPGEKHSANGSRLAFCDSYLSEKGNGMHYLYYAYTSFNGTSTYHVGLHAYFADGDSRANGAGSRLIVISLTLIQDPELRDRLVLFMVVVFLRGN